MWSLYSHTNTNQLKLHLIMPFPKPLVQICIHNPYAERQWNISKQRNCHVNLIICFFAVEINGSPKGCQTEMFVLFLPLSVPLFNLFLWAFYEAFYLCHFELLTLEVLFLHPKRVFPWDTISLSPSSMNKHVLHHFWLKSSTTKQVSIHLTCNWSCWVQW